MTVTIHGEKHLLIVLVDGKMLGDQNEICLESKNENPKKHKNISFALHFRANLVWSIFFHRKQVLSLNFLDRIFWSIIVSFFSNCIVRIFYSEFDI